MKKCILIIVMALSVAVVFAGQNKNEGSSNAVNNQNAVVDWITTPVASIPLEAHMPVYDTVIDLGNSLTKAELDEKAKFYFRQVFNSRAVTMQKRKHHYEGNGMYLFCADKRGGAANVYQVFYNIDVRLKHHKLYVTVSDFSIKNQNVEVSFPYLLARAKNNEMAAIKILSYFQKNNEHNFNTALAALVPSTATTNEGMASNP